MKQLILILFCLALLLPMSAWGASCTNVKTGTWATYSTWSSATCRHVDKPVPGSGAFANYSAVIKSGTVVTVDDSRTIYATSIGTAVSGQIGHLVFDGGENDITVTSAGRFVFTVNTNTTSKLTINAGVTWNLGTSLVVAGNNNVWDTPRWDWIINGTAERRVNITSSRYIYGNATYSRGAINWNSATLNGFTAGTNTLNAYYGVTLKNCLFKSATPSSWTFGSVSARIAPNAPLDVANTDFRTAGNVIFFTEAGAATGTRLVKDSSFATTNTTSSRPTLTIQGNDRWGGRLTFDHCVFYHYLITETNSAGNTFNNCAFYIGPHSAGVAEIIVHGGDGDTITNNLFYTSNNNNHGFMGSSITSGVVPLGPNTYRNNVVENVYNTDTANIIIPSTTAGITVENNLFIGTGLNAVTFGLRGGKAVATSAVNTITNNTFSWWGSGYYWEHGTAGTPQNGTNIFKNNLMYANLNTVFGMIEGNTGPSTGQLDYADYNAFYRTGTTPYIRNMALANWTEETRGTLTYLSATSFRVAGVDVTGTYTAGKVLSIRIGTKRAWVKCHATTPSAYSGGNTTVILAADYGALTNGLTQVYYNDSNKTYGVDDGWGLHDLYANPNFLDSSRLLAGYTSSTAVAFFDELVKINGYDKTGAVASRSNSWSTADAIIWLKAGFTPTNPVFATSSDTGSYIGVIGPNANLSVIIAGFGSGTVNSLEPNGIIHCSKPSQPGDNCSATHQPVGTPITLNATPNSTSLFTGWSLAGCPGTGDCSFTLNNDTSVTTTFITLPPVKVVGSSGTFYRDLLQTACNDAPAGATIFARTAPFTETLTVNKPGIVTLKGGYDAGFANQTGYSQLQGLIIRSGSLIIDCVTVKSVPFT